MVAETGWIACRVTGVNADDADQREELKVVLLAIAGSDAAFETLVRRHQSCVRALLRRACGNAALADDLAQIAFAKAWRGIGGLRDAARFRPWLRRIALHAAVDAARAGKVALEPLDQEAAPDPSARAHDQRLDVEAALRRLSFAQRACVLLSYGEEMSHAEIAAALRMPVGTVKSHIARATPLLRRWLADWRNGDG